MRIILALLLCVVLAACGGVAEEAVTTTSYKPPANPGGRLCIAQCGTAREYCRQDCDLETRDCVGKVQSQALRDYDKYTREQFAARQPIELRPRDFERMVPCDDTKKRCTSRCESQYQTCYKNCGGTVNIESSCQFMCF